MNRARHQAAHFTEPARELMIANRKLQLALELAAAGPDTVGERAAWQHAEEASAELGRAVEAFLPADKIVASARRAVTRERQAAKRKKAEER